MNDQTSDTGEKRIVIIGGGAAGSLIATLLAEADISALITVLEPSEYLYDQPAWMRVATEGAQKEETQLKESEFLPQEATWIRAFAASIDPDAQTVTTLDDEEVPYDILVVAVGVETRWDQIPGLRESLGEDGVCSVYGYDQAERAWETIESFHSGRAIFTAPPGPFKGASAPITVMHQAEEFWRNKGVRDRIEVIFATAGSSDYGGRAYDDLIKRDIAEDKFTIWPHHELIQVRPENKEAVFRITDKLTGSESVVTYDLLHVVPPMRAPEVIASSKLACDDEPLKGFLDVDLNTLRHSRYTNVFGAGDINGVAIVKTREYAREQASKVARAIKNDLTEPTRMR